MKRKIFLRIIIGITAIVLLVVLLTKVFVEPWIEKKIKTTLIENSGDYLLKIEKVHVLIFSSGIELENITLLSKKENEGKPNLTGEIETVKFKGIHLIKAFFGKDIDIREVGIFNSRLTGKVAFPKKAKLLKVSPVNIRIENLLFDKFVVDVKSTTTAQAYSVKDGVLKVFDINVEKNDTLSPNSFGQFDFEAIELKTVTPDSLYTISAVGINYSSTSNTLKANRFVVHPNYTEYGFTSRNQFQKDRIEAEFNNIYVHDFYAENYFKYKNMVSSYIEIGEMDMKVFRDNRKEFRHKNKPPFQNMIYNYPGIINIDSIGIINGNITYTEHVEKASGPGMVSFKKIHAKIYKISNDSVYKTESASIELKADALLMGKGKLSIILKAGIFDSQNTFSVDGKLSDMEAKEINPMLENNAFIYATSGKIDTMNFNFTANNTEANGKMTLFYHGLNILVKNKRTDDTTAIKEQILSFVANIKMIDSNPIPGEDIREGIIYYERDPERFLFNYCFKSILSGIKSSVYDRPKKKRKLS